MARPLSIAPMMDRTDPHFRFLMRQITRHTLLYTEMVTTSAILNGDQDYLLAYDPSEHPLVVQLGGEDPADLATCAKICEDRGFDEVNLNVGCPSSRVQGGAFGCVLMRRPERVAEAVAAMQAAVSIPVTVKHRIGVDDLDAYEDMEHFVEVVAAAGCTHFTVHARKAWLQGLSPKQNRNVPPLRYDDVYRLKQSHEALTIEINGGITSLDQARAQLEHVDAVMIGRFAWDRPWAFSEADARFFGDARVPDRGDVIAAMADYATSAMKRGHNLPHVLRTTYNLFAGEPGTKLWKRTLADASQRPGADGSVLFDALAAVEELRSRQDERLCAVRAGTISGEWNSPN